MDIIISIIICIPVSNRAKNHGYSRCLWFIASFLFSPFASLCLLTILPNRSIEKKRRKELILLRRQIFKDSFTRKRRSSTISNQTISDDITMR